MSFVATIANPEYNYSGGGSGLSAAVGVARAAMRFEFNAVSELTMKIAHDVVSKYNLETDDTNNPVQLNSTVELARDGAIWFRGFIDSKPTIKDNKRYIEANCMGREGVLLTSLCVDANGNDCWTMKTDTIQIGASSPYLPLKKCTVYGTFESDTLWPNPADATGAKCYIQDSDCPSDTINADIGAGDSAPFYVELTTTDKGLSPQGWAKLHNEWMYYESYDPTGGGSRYQVRVKARAQLGTSAADHSAGTILYNKIAKRLGPEPPVIRKDGNELRHGEEFSAHVSYGCFVLVGTAGASTFTGTYYVYDEDLTLGGSTVVYLEDVVEVFCTGPGDHGGADFTSGDCDFDATGIAITRYDYDPADKEHYAWNAIQELLEALGLQDEYAFWFDHTTGKLRLAQLGNAVSPDFSFAHVERVYQEMSIHDVFSAVRVAFQHDQDENRIQKQYSYHQAAAGSGLSPDYYRMITKNSPGWSYDPGDCLDCSSAGSDGMSVLYDGKLETKLIGEFTHDPGAAPIKFVFGDFWFGAGATPPIINLDLIELYVNSYRVIDTNQTRRNTQKTYVVKVQACDDYSTGSHDTAGNGWHDLDTFEGLPAVNGKSVKFEIKKFILREANAIRIVFEYMAGYKTVNSYLGIVHQLKVQGNNTSYALIQTTDDAAKKGLPPFLYVPDTHKKLRGGVNSSGAAGSPRTKHIDIGAASYGGAVTIGRALLESAITLYQMRTYEYEGELNAKPELGDTIEIDETGNGSADYTGVMRALELEIAADGIGAEFDVLDYDAGDLT